MIEKEIKYKFGDKKKFAKTDEGWYLDYVLMEELGTETIYFTNDEISDLYEIFCEILNKPQTANVVVQVAEKMPEEKPEEHVIKRQPIPAFARNDPDAIAYLK